jgi:hypothetical protein
VIEAAKVTAVELPPKMGKGIEGAAPMIKSFGCDSANRCVAVGSTSLVGVRKPSHDD